MKIKYTNEAKAKAKELVEEYGIQGTLANLSSFADHMQAAQKASGKIAGFNLEKDQHKVAGYCDLFVVMAKFLDAIAATGKNSRKITTKVSKDVQSLLTTTGVSGPNAKRYFENTRRALLSTEPQCQGLLLAAQTSAQAVSDWFQSQDPKIETESAIKRLTVVDDPIQKLAERVAKLKPADRKRFEKILSNLDRDAEVKQAKQDIAKKEMEERRKANAKKTSNKRRRAA